ncbi:hypothetical protein [Streptomyces sp. NPDC057636]|uniref:hypothetical protein n=1 Tax=Streptomyces sp. NPDC057636 TaxID=3346189 RepID=UPI003687E9F5
MTVLSHPAWRGVERDAGVVDDRVEVFRIQQDVGRPARPSVIRRRCVEGSWTATPTMTAATEAGAQVSCPPASKRKAVDRAWAVVNVK